MAANPNPARITDQMWAVWEGFAVICPSARLGGIYAPKPGYHGTRDENSPSNYSVAQYPIDRQGPGDKAAADDFTFPDAQGGNYSTIAVYSRRLYAAGQAGRTADPRTVYLREFYGNTDNDTEVEGWDYARGGPASSDSTHLWHIHLSIHRGYVNDPEMTRAVLSILRGETVEQWRGGDEMFTIVPDANGTLWLCNGMLRRTISNPQEVADLQYLAAQGAIQLWQGGQVWPGGIVPAFGVDIATLGADVDEAALAAGLAPLLPKPLTSTQTVAAVNTSLQSTTGQTALVKATNDALESDRGQSALVKANETSEDQ